MNSSMRSRFLHVVLVVSILVVGTAGWQRCGAEEAGELPVMAEAPLSVTEPVLDAKLKEAQSNQELDEVTRTKLTELYDKTRSHLETIQANQAKTRSYSQALSQAAEDAKELRSAIEKRRTTPPWLELGADENTPLEEIAARLLKEKADRAASAARLEDLVRQLGSESERPTAIRLELAEARKEQARVAADLKLPPPQDQLQVVSEAWRWQLEGLARSLSTRTLMLEQEVLSHPARFALIKVQREQQENRVEHLGGRVRYLENIAAQRRTADAKQAKQEAEAAEQRAEGKHPILRSVAEGNTALSNALEKTAGELAQIARDDDRVIELAKGIEEGYRNARQKLEITGLSEALGQVLLQNKRKLPDQDMLQQQAEQRQALTVDVTLRHLQHSQAYKALRYLDDYVAEITRDLTLQQSVAVEQELTALLASRKEILSRYLTTDDAYLRALSELEIAQNRLLEAVKTLDAFLSKRLLWIRSDPGVDLDSAATLRKELAPMLSALDWGQVPRQLASRGASPGLWLGLLLVLWLRLRTGVYYRALHASADTIRRPSTDRFRYTLKALGLTLLIAAPWPLLIAVLGWELGQGQEVSQFTHTLSGILLWLAPVYFHLRFFRTLCKPGGVAMEHFRWPQTATDCLRRQLTALMWTFLPGVLLVGMIINIDPNDMGGEWGRLCLVVVMLLLSAFCLRLFGPRRGALHQFMQWAPQSVLARLRYLWLVVSVTLPLFLAGLALFGYTYTAVILVVHLVETLWLIVALVVMQQTALRWLLVSRRRIALRVALEKRELRRAAAQREAAGVADSEPQTLAEDLDIDVVALSQESRKLVNLALFSIAMIGLWSVWRDVVPAFGILSDIDLWHRVVVVGGEEKLVPVTLANLILGILVLILTAIAVKRLPALLELIMIELLDIGPGERYTVTTLTGYALVVAGALYVFSALGVDWSKLQWLVAALGVGIGFGLQEIVANFISGLIILFERPIRVGDVVTVGDVDGTVTRIRIRATTIRNWDNKELLVPNKEFITSRLLNWTLSDPVTRIMVNVGIAYGSDVAKATELMLEVARANDAVLDEPSPSVVFEAFGDNALTMVLRCYIPNTEARMGIISRLNHGVNEKFNAAGIIIAFPQRDIHLDTSSPLEVHVRHGG